MGHSVCGQEAFIFAAGSAAGVHNINDVLMAVWQHIGDFNPNEGGFQWVGKFDTEII